VLLLLTTDEQTARWANVVRKLARRKNQLDFDTEDSAIVEYKLQIQSDRLLRAKMGFLNLFLEDDIRLFYPMLFEVYMTVCCLLCIRGGGIQSRTCVVDLFIVPLWSLFVMSEDAKLRSYQGRDDKSEASTRRPLPLFKLPSPVVKVVYLLYTPPRFWICIWVLVLMNIALITEFGHKFKIAMALMILFFNIVIYRNLVVFDTCPLMN
jgi:hypothetical protein